MYSEYYLFINNTGRLEKYRQAIRLLQEAGVHHVLSELAASIPVPKGHTTTIETAALTHYENVGYQRCLADVFRLEEIVQQQERRVSADFGAIESLLASGEITKEQAEELRKG